MQNQNVILLEKLSKLEKTSDQQVTSNSHEDLSKKGDRTTMIEEQRQACVNERHRKYEQYCIENRFRNSKGKASQSTVSKEMPSQQEPNRNGNK